DDTLVALHPKNDVLQGDLDRVLRQRNTLLKQAGGRLTDEVEATLDVWDAKLASLGGALAVARGDLVFRLQPVLAKAYDDVASASADVEARYERSWSGGRGEAL